ncbi:MAG: radical SAM protein [Syntrophorhabdaceae bacterium]|nr:radical SAM protein [Syntrophorhabdaceae bacterium]
MQKPVFDVDHIRILRKKAGLIHPVFGDLSRPDCIVMPEPFFPEGIFNEREFDFIHLTVTNRCNARCEGCINGLFLSYGENSKKKKLFVEMEPERDGEAILRLAKMSKKKNTMLCLYGGEPLLEMDKIERLHKFLVKEKKSTNLYYMVYTNGDMLKTVSLKHRDFLSWVYLFSVSIDGREDQHNRIRRGTSLSKIHEGLEGLKGIRKGDVLMWSTLRDTQSLWDCFEEFMGLRDKGLVEHFFWHWVEIKSPFVDLKRYADTYENELRMVMDTYMKKLSAGELLSIIHINELILYLLTGKKRKTTGCGVEVDRNYDIVGGNIYPCADMPLTEPIGYIRDDGEPVISPYRLSYLTAYKKELGCYECGVHSYCGGRCPVQAMASEAARLIQYCQLMRLHVGTVMEYIPELKTIIEKNEITLQQIYDKSAFFVQFTDVTP